MTVLSLPRCTPFLQAPTYKWCTVEVYGHLLNRVASSVVDHACRESKNGAGISRNLCLDQL